MTNGTFQGLFVIIAIIIFSIFVMISYLLFQDKMTNGLSTIFCESFNIVNKETGLGGQETCNIVSDTNKDENLVSEISDETNQYTKIRDKNDLLNETEIWVKTRKNDDNTISIIDSASNLENIRKEGKQQGLGIINGSIVIPKTIDGLIVSNIETASFSSAQLIGSYKDFSVKTIGNTAFKESKFTGGFSSPELIEVGSNSFEKGRFTGDLNAPNLKTIGDLGFLEARFDGKFNVNSIEKIGQSGLKNSPFIGTINVTELKSVGDFSFQSAKFTGDFINNKLSTVNKYSFRSSKFNGKIESNSIKTIENYAFDKSEFKTIKLRKDVNIQGFNGNLD